MAGCTSTHFYRLSVNNKPLDGAIWNWPIRIKYSTEQYY